LGRIISMSETGIENSGKFELKILEILMRRAIKHKLISLYLQTKAFYKIARIAKILNEQQSAYTEPGYLRDGF